MAGASRGSMMAAGRGEFFQKFSEGLKINQPCAPAALSRRQPRRGPGPGGLRSCPGSETQSDRKVKKSQSAAAAPSSVSGNSLSSPEMNTYPSKEKNMERLPPEILLVILSYLDAASLSSISHVSKLFHKLANDDVIWHKIYMSDFGSQMWSPKSTVGDATLEGRLVSHWKKMYFRTKNGQIMNMWRREMRDVSPYTGLPEKTERVLRNLNVTWELTVCGCQGREVTLEQSRAHFSESSVIIHWNGWEGRFLKYYQIRNIQLYGVRNETPKSCKARRPGWRSLISKLDLKTQHSWLVGKDSLIKLRHLQPGFIIGTWRGDDSVAFIMVSLHFHRLVEKSLLGFPFCPYSEPADLAPVDNSDPEFGLHGYSLHFVLHTTGTEIMSGHFRHLCSPIGQIRSGMMELRVISRTKMSQHRALSGNIKLPWKRETLEGSVENCCIMTLTLLDVFQKPFWCVSSSIFIVREKKQLSFDYGGEPFMMFFQNPEGQVKMKLVWLEEHKHFFLTSLTVSISVSKVNKRFSKAY